MPDQIYSVTWNGKEKVSYTYDPLGRLTNKKLASFSNLYAYEDVGEDQTTTLVKSVETPAGTYSYTYDNIGNILSIADGTYTATYAYDEFNQLTRVNDERAGKTYTYSYSNGNITERTEYAYTTGELGEAVDTKTWTYGDSVWSDLLTDFNGTPITYDEIGNPLTMGSRELSWRGRQLTHISDGENEISYAYNGDGQRVSKTVNGTTTEYIYNGELLAGQKTGDNILVFMYDNNGDIFGFIDGGTEYYYVKNAQNDVTAIANADGTVIANYYYDSWGKLIEITGDTAIAELNPIRYRSYYYDSETEWYFLNSRYYSPELCRFISGDSQINDDTLGNNLFSYCGDNPINRADKQGEGWWIVAGAAIGAVASFAGTVISNVSSGRVWHTGWAGALAGGAVAGALAASGHPVAGAFAGAFVESAVNEALSYTSAAKSNGSSRKANTRRNRVNSYIRVARDTAVNGSVGAIAGQLANKFIKVNSGWFKPVKIKSCFVGKYALKFHGQTVISEVLNSLSEEIYIGLSNNGQEPILELYPSEEREEGKTE